MKQKSSALSNASAGSKPGLLKSMPSPSSMTCRLKSESSEPMAMWIESMVSPPAEV